MQKTPITVARLVVENKFPLQVQRLHDSMRFYYENRKEKK